MIEHLEKSEGKELLARTEDIAREQVVIFTPLGFMPQHHENSKDAWGLNGADWQEHKSGWFPEDFQGEFWQVFASKSYHFRPQQKPFGAMWAIKSFPSFDPPRLWEERLETSSRISEFELGRKLAEWTEKSSALSLSFPARLKNRVSRMLGRRKK